MDIGLTKTHKSRHLRPLSEVICRSSEALKPRCIWERPHLLSEVFARPRSKFRCFGQVGLDRLCERDSHVLKLLKQAERQGLYSGALPLLLARALRYFRVEGTMKWPWVMLIDDVAWSLS